MTTASNRLRSVTARLASFAGLAVVVACGWFATMELLLRHDGYGWRAVAAIAIVAEAALTIAVCEDLFEFVLLRWPLTAGVSATGVLGAWLIVQDLGLPGLPSSPHFEGYLLIIGTVLITYAVVTIAAMNVTGKNRRGH